MKGWWQPPRLRVSKSSAEERHATWLELFFDLVFVVAVSQLAQNLNRDVSLSGFLNFVTLFVPVWWAWIGAAFYATRFDTDDLGYRLLTLGQMLAIAALSVNVHDGLGKSSAGFALSYAAVRGVLILQYLRAGWHVVTARPLTTRYIYGFSVAAVIWLVSAFVPIPMRFVLWVLGLTLDMATPLSAWQLHAQLPPDTSHLLERFGLFTLIVLGESIAAVINGIAIQPWNLWSGIAAAFGLVLAFSLWWIYFDYIDDAAILATRVPRRIWLFEVWLYTHLLLVIGLTATGVGVQNTVLNASYLVLPGGARWLLCSAVAIYLLALGVIYLTNISTKRKRRYQLQSLYRIGAAAIFLVLAISGAELLPVVLLGLVTLICAAQVVQDLFWKSRSGS